MEGRPEEGRDMRTRSTPRLDDALLVHVCEMFLEGRKTREIAAWVNGRLGLGEEDPNRLTREQVYPLLQEARGRGFFHLLPPVSLLHQRIAERYAVAPDRIQVVSARGPESLDYVAAHAAALLLRLTTKLARLRARTDAPAGVHVGLGAGWTTRKVAYHLSRAMRNESQLPPVVLHAISCGVDVEQPQTSPISFFGYFEDLPHRVDYVGLFASPIVDSSHYEGLRLDPGVADALERKGEIDIVATALASVGHRHFGLNRMLERNPEDVDFLRSRGWIGDVQYRPFSRHGPIVEEASRRVVTLFELDELVELASRKEKYVVVAAGPCHCGETRAEALRPLLEEPRLRLWTHLVMDLDTAGSLLAD